MRTRIFTLLICFVTFSNQLLGQKNGDLTNATFKAIFPAELLELLVSLQFEGEGAEFITALAGIQYPVAEFELTYLTTFPDGNLGVASGQVCLPIIPSSGAVQLPLASYLHGTITSNAEAPTQGEGIERVVALTYASSGYVAASPDYLGFGASAATVRLHPYLDAETEASAAIDLLRATRQFVAQLPFFSQDLANINLNDQVFLTGYSQGGHSVIATQKAIQKHYRDEFKLETVVGGSGPYDLPGVQRDFVLDNPNYSNPAFLPYFVLGQREVRNDIALDPLEDIFTDPMIADNLFYPKDQSVGDIDGVLNPLWKENFTDEYISDVETQFFHPVNNALRANRLTYFAPKTNTWLLFCTEDEQVDFRNALVAWFNYFIRGAGFKVKAATLGPQTHAECAPFAILAAKLLFDLRKQTSGLAPSARTTMSEEPPAHLDPEQYQRIRDIVENRNLPDLEAWLIEAGLDDLRAQLIDGGGLQPLTLYPNPVQDYAILDHSMLEAPIRQISIHDLSGKKIKELALGENGVIIIDRSGLSSGKYIVRLLADKTHSLQMMVK